MSGSENLITYRVLVLITTPTLADMAGRMFDSASIPVNYRVNAMGTASSEMLDILGLGSSDKMLMMSTVPTDLANDMLHKLKRELKIGAVNSGIAFTLPITSASSIVLKLFDNKKAYQVENDNQRKDKKAMSDMKYSLITAIVNQGFSDKVADVARQAGACGGTVLHSHTAGDSRSGMSLGLADRAEKEIVLIVASAQSKLGIMQEISANCGMSSEAQGVVMSLPIDEVIGLNE